MDNLGSFGESEDSLERFKQRLERGGKAPLTLKSTRVPRSTFNIRRSWDEDGVDLSTLAPENKGASNRWLTSFFWGALIFFLATSAIAFYVLFYSTNIVSATNIDLEVKGPSQIRSGEELNLETTIRNRNKVTLHDVSLTITYPAGTVDSLEAAKDLPLWRETVSDLNPGQSALINSRAIIYGDQNSNQKITLKIEYHIPDSNAVFTKEAEYQVLIGSGTVDLAYDAPTEINVSKAFDSDLKITSNSQTVLRQVSVRVDFPAGFNFESSDPEPKSGQQIWYLGDLAPGVIRHIKIRGSLSGQSEELKPFKFSVGLDRSAGQGDLSPLYGSLSKTISLKKDFVTIAIDLNKNSLVPGDSLDGTVSWDNNLPEKVINGSLELYLSGSAIDKKTVDSSNGFYNSLTNSIVWDKTNVAGLGVIDPGDNGKAKFELSLLPLSRLSSGGAIAPVSFRLVFKGTKVTEEAFSEDIVSEIEKSLKIGTLVKFVSNGTYFVGPFKNTGPLPPKVGEETTYTVNWSITNPTNRVNGAKVSANLPLYVKWLSSVSPLDEKVIYDKTNNEVTWNLGSVEPGTITDGATRQASFQISITPSLSQVGEAVDLVKNISFTGTDAVTGAVINLPASVINTRLSSDPSFVAGQEKVAE